MYLKSEKKINKKEEKKLHTYAFLVCFAKTIGNIALKDLVIKKGQC